jgi:hypothetical protein
MYDEDVFASITVIFGLDKNEDFNLLNGIVSVGNTPELKIIEDYIKKLKSTKLSDSEFNKIYVTRTLIKNKNFLKDILSSNLVSYYYKFVDDEFLFCKIKMDSKEITLCEEGTDSNEMIEIDIPIYLSE